ncbi:MAG TPA: cytochrome c3 family protein [Gemmatimonadales bacterium]|nr:cytochrome c3 family protein [Gemmatimonadales bacterium]
MKGATLVTTLRLGALLVLAWPPQAASQPSRGGSCVACHELLPDSRLSDPAKNFPLDVHAAKGFDCVACHGGDASVTDVGAMDRAKGFLGKPRHQQIPQLCGRCHSSAEFMKRYNPALRVDEVAEYATSVHGQRLAQFDDPRVATCASCHPAHAIRPPSDPQSSVHPFNVAKTCGGCHAKADYMASYGIPTDQLDKYEKSVHWQAMSVRHDLSAPTCNDCHGNHGATPPGVSWVGNVCGQCHSVMAANFAKSPHGRSFPLMGIPGCVACHNNHDIHATSDTMLGLGKNAVCTQCHEAGTAAGDQAAAMRQLIDSLRTELDSAAATLKRAERSGVEVSQAQFDLQGAHNALVSSRAAMHTFNLATLAAEVAGGRKITAEGFVRGRRALAELRFRRTGLAVSVVIILVLIVALVLKIRVLDARPAPPRTPH